MRFAVRGDFLIADAPADSNQLTREARAIQFSICGIGRNA